MKELIVGGLYEYIAGEYYKDSELWCIYHNDDDTYPDGDQVKTFLKVEKYVVLDVKKFKNRLFSVKVLSSAGTVGRLYINPDDWKKLDQ